MISQLQSQYCRCEIILDPKTEGSKECSIAKNWSTFGFEMQLEWLKYLSLETKCLIAMSCSNLQLRSKQPGVSIKFE